MKALNVMTSNLVAAREGSTAREIGTKLLIGNFNGLPVINSSIKVIGIVTAVDILRLYPCTRVSYPLASVLISYPYMSKPFSFT